MKHYVVTLKNHEDLDNFYQDMETPGGKLYIPDRAIELIARRPNSRNTHYWLTDEEAELIKNDDRVLDVDLVISERGIVATPYWTQTGNFEKSSSITNTDKNWALYRCTAGTQLANWGTNGAFTETTQTISTIGSGKNVDVVIGDAHINFNHPEFAVNADGTGGSRAIQYNWFQHSASEGYTTTGTYNYSTIDSTHGTHVAGTVAGNTQGWARDANIYNIAFNYPGTNYTNTASLWSGAMWDYMKQFHRNKSFNPVTKRKNPTITNHSWGYSIPILYINNVGAYLGTPENYPSHSISSMTYRGTTTTYAVEFTSAQVSDAQAKVASLRAKGLYVVVPNTGQGTYVDNLLAYIVAVPSLTTQIQVDVIDAIKEGVIVISAAGNSSFHCDKPGGVDYDNNFTYKYLTNTVVHYPHRGSAPSGIPGVICVGNIGTKTQEYKSDSSNYGPRIDVWAPGTNIMSSLAYNTGDASAGYSPVADSRNSSFYLGRATGTSMASPQVCGIVACMAENWVRSTQVDAYRYLAEFSKYDQVGNTGTTNYMDVESASASGSAWNNRYLYYNSYRKSSGFMSFKTATYTQRTIPSDMAALIQQVMNLPSAPTQPLKYPRKNTLVYRSL